MADLFYNKRYSATIFDDKVDFIKVAEAMGAKAYRITKQEEVIPVFKEAIQSDVPVFIECMIDRDEKVFPMVAPGAPISEAFNKEDLDRKSIEE